MMVKPPELFQCLVYDIIYLFSEKNNMAAIQKGPHVTKTKWV